MGLNIIKLPSTKTIHLLADGLTFKIVSATEGVTDTIDENNSKRIIAFLNGGTETEKIVSRIRAGEVLDEVDKSVSLQMNNGHYNYSNFMILTVIVNDIDKASWTGAMLRDEGVIHLPAGVLKDILTYLINAGIKPGPRPYYIIKSVPKLPITTRTDIAWLLTDDDGDKKAGTIWRWDGEKWCPVEDADSGDSDEGGDCNPGYGTFIISEEEPENLVPGIVWARVD